VLSLPNAEPNPAAEQAMHDLIRAQFAFHCNTGLLDRRVFPRLHDEWMDHLTIDHSISAGPSSR
jgi:hypothetical protein